MAAGMLDLGAIDGVVSDMDGVLWRGDTALPGLAAFFAMLARRGVPVALASNNSGKSRAEYVAKLAAMGVTGLTEANIVTSRTAMVDYLATRYAKGTTAYVIGTPGLAEAIAAIGFRLGGDAQVVVVGIDYTLSYDKLKRASLLLRAGADFLGTNGDLSVPSREGLAPGNGAVLAALEAATGRAPTVIGKPARPMYETALRVLGTPAARTLMIGDRLDTDIAAAAALGLRTALVLSGVTSAADAARGPIRPDAIFAGLPEVLAAWDAA